MVGLDGEVKECIVLKTQSQLTHYWHVFLCLSFKCEGGKVARMQLKSRQAVLLRSERQKGECKYFSMPLHQ